MPSSKIKMTFQCNENWNSMPLNGLGRHCELCDKTVQDFSKHSKKELKKLKVENEQLCGNFAPHQVDYSLYPVSKIWPKRRFLATSIFVFLGITNLKGQTSQSDSTAITQEDKKESLCHLKKDPLDEVLKDIKKRKRRRHRKRMAVKHAVCIESRGRTSTYLTWRYPFIVKMHHFMGKFR